MGIAIHRDYNHHPRRSIIIRHRRSHHPEVDDRGSSVSCCPGLGGSGQFAHHHHHPENDDPLSPVQDVGVTESSQLQGIDQDNLDVEGFTFHREFPDFIGGISIARP